MCWHVAVRGSVPRLEPRMVKNCLVVSHGLSLFGGLDAIVVESSILLVALC